MRSQRRSGSLSWCRARPRACASSGCTARTRPSGCWWRRRVTRRASSSCPCTTRSAPTWSRTFRAKRRRAACPNTALRLRHPATVPACVSSCTTSGARAAIASCARQMASVVCSAAELPNLIQRCPFASVVAYGAVSAELRAQCASAGFKLVLFDELEAAGGKALPLLSQLQEPGAADIALLCYTSGTTGDPKGAMLSHGNVISATAMQSFPYAPGKFLINEDVQEVHLSYLPLAHIFETVVMNSMLSLGGAVGFYQGDTLKILDDLQALRPTVFVSVPRLYNRIYDKIVGGAAAKGYVASTLFSKGLAAKLAAFDATGALTHRLWDTLVFKKVAAQLGLDRCHTMFTGSAPLSDTVKDFMRVAFAVKFVEGYGMTESAAAGTLCNPLDPSKGHVGAPVVSIEIKLQDVPEMNYLSSGAPPRGEICMRGPSVFKGYFMMPDKTAETVDGEGWLHTGDIGEWTGVGTLKIIDRKKNIFKLAQGEYVAAEKIENVCMRVPLVAQCFVYGDSLQSYLVGIVVPDAEEVVKWAGAKGVAAPSAEAVVAGAEGGQLAADIQQQMAAACKEAKLQGFEMVKKVALEPEVWSVENGILTPTFKLKRNEAKKKYIEQINAMYAEGVAPTSKL
eukprot:Transcript_25102.p1 GENE.Transcript_25102~~Transcript_25102.p1  ORF type:complete len:624 (-),score=271.51 Transcript_25102:79-1950(-)